MENLCTYMYSPDFNYAYIPHLCLFFMLRVASASLSVAFCIRLWTFCRFHATLHICIRNVNGIMSVWKFLESTYVIPFRMHSVISSIALLFPIHWMNEWAASLVQYKIALWPLKKMCTASADDTSESTNAH